MESASKLDNSVVEQAVAELVVAQGIQCTVASAVADTAGSAADRGSRSFEAASAVAVAVAAADLESRLLVAAAGIAAGLGIRSFATALACQCTGIVVGRKVTAAAAGHHIAADSQMATAVGLDGQHCRPGMNWNLNTSLRRMRRIQYQHMVDGEE